VRFGIILFLLFFVSFFNVLLINDKFIIKG
jgi:hypothetical protein